MLKLIKDTNLKYIQYITCIRTGGSYRIHSIGESARWCDFHYTNGNVLYRASILSGLKHRNTSFFFQTDILIRLIKSGYLFAEVPYRIRVREGGKWSAITFPSFFRVVKGYFYLVGSIYSLSIFSRKQKKSFFPNKTLTANRRIENKAWLVIIFSINVLFLLDKASFDI